jgi:hypothetical protein
MTVHCVTNTVQPADYPFEYLDDGEKYRDDITVGASYIVYGVGTINSIPVYLICSDGYTYYPVFVSAAHFDGFSGSLPRGLVPSVSKTELLHSFIVSAPAFAKDEYFYDSLTDGDRAAVATWNAFKTYVDAEHNLTVF